MDGIPSSVRTSMGVASSRPELTHKVSDASQEFESVLLGQWLQQAEASFGSVPGDEDEDSGDSQMKNFAMQHLAQQITKFGGIGISKMVERELTKSAGLDPPALNVTARSGKTT